MNKIKSCKLSQSRELAVVEIDGYFYVIEIDHDSHQVKSHLPSDMPDGGGCWFAGISDAGVRYVASPRTRHGAMSGYYRMKKYHQDLYC